MYPDRRELISQSSARSAHGPPAPPTDRAAAFHPRRRARGAHGRVARSGGCALGACGSIRSDRAAMTSPPSARARARADRVRAKARAGHSRPTAASCAGSMRSTASARRRHRERRRRRARQVVEREIGVARADRRLERGGVGQPRDRDARGRARRAAVVDRIRPAHAPQVDQRRGALDHAVAAGRLARKQSRDLPVRRSRSRPGTRSAWPAAP